MLKIFYCAICHLYIPFGDIFAVFCPFSTWILWLLIVEFYELFLFSSQQSFVGYMAFKFFSYLQLVFSFLHRISHKEKFSIQMRSNLLIFLKQIMLLMSNQRNLPTSRSRFSLVTFSEINITLHFTFKSVTYQVSFQFYILFY